MKTQKRIKSVMDTNFLSWRNAHTVHYLRGILLCSCEIHWKKLLREGTYSTLCPHKELVWLRHTLIYCCYICCHTLSKMITHRHTHIQNPWHLSLYTLLLVWNYFPGMLYLIYAKHVSSWGLSHKRRIKKSRINN